MLKTCKECANYDHKNLKRTKACGKCIITRYQDGTESDPSNWRALPQTNADRIRAMSDEELAEWLVQKTTYQESAWSAPSYLNFLTESDDTLESAIKGTAQWLKQPVKGE